MKKFYSSLAMMAVLPALASCGEGNSIIPPVVDNIAEQCGLDCKTAVEANGSVSGSANIDAFFTAALKLQTQATLLEADVQGTLVEMAIALGLETEGRADLAGDIAAYVSGGFDGKVDGEIAIKFQPPRCEISAEATLQASARCDAEVKPGEASVKCEGGCVVDAEASCEGQLKCTGKLPTAECTGACEGSCEVEAGAKCEGSCSGTCNLEVAGKCDGECAGSTDGEGNCTGECKLNAGAKCEGTCQGSCELSGGATCKGTCKGTCTFDPGGASCDGELTCEASAKAECKGECKGKVVPPMVKAECKASVQAEANLDAECKPPSLDVDYSLNAEWAASADADAKLEFEAQIQGFIKAFAKLKAKDAKLVLVAEAGAGLVDAGANAFGDIVGDLSAKGELRVKIGALCAVEALPGTIKLIEDASDSVNASISAVAKITGSVGG